jgi:hypothetical protein
MTTYHLEPLSLPQKRDAGFGKAPSWSVNVAQEKF